MPTIQVEARISTEQLLRAVDQMPADELAAFAQRVLERRARRVAPLLSREESALLDRANRTLPPESAARYDELVRRRQDDSLSEAEHAELIALSDAQEQLDADRIAALTELAGARGVALGEVMAAHGTSTPRP